MTREEPSQDLGWFWLASVTESLQMRLSYLKKALDLNPETPQAAELFTTTKTQFVCELLTQGTFAAKSGMKDYATYFLLYAAELDPGNESVWLTIAQLDEPPEDLAELLRRVLKINPGNIQALAMLSEIEETPATTELQLETDVLPLSAPVIENPAEQPPVLPPAMPAASFEETAPELTSMEPPAPLPVLEMESTTTPEVAPVPPQVQMPSLTNFTRCPLCEQEFEMEYEQCPRCGGQIILKNFITPPNGSPKVKFDRRHSLLAVARYGQALAKDPQNAQLHYNIGLAYLNLNRLDVAIRSLRRAEELYPDQNLASAVIEFSKMPALPTPAEPAAGGQGAAPEKQSREQKSILIVDDSPTIRKLIAHTLGKCGYRVIPAVDGPDALAKIGEVDPDLVFLDIVMPNLDWYQVCKLIREKKKDLPVVMMSGRDGFFDKVRGKVAGSTEYITKPFDTQTLIQMAGKYCSMTV
jgi:twitching motility two-component system response regulator PilG